ncbi:DSBA-like thioredoxin domain-containing protein [Flagelloscypha sp. PMI_526]|nr:DSBA-like thioredoxin domain-containing protein [Flagelloscypha sp. PMI_526]
MTHFKIDLVSDTVCPWCYVGKKRLEKAIIQHKKTHPSDTFSITFFPFYLDPSAPLKGEDKRTRYEQKFGGPTRVDAMFTRLASIGEAEGIHFKFGGKTGNTRDSHRLIQLGKTKGLDVQKRVIEELFSAYFENEKDITDHATLTDAGVKAGLEEKEVKEWLGSDSGGREVDREVAFAQMRNISGVPNFTFQEKYQVGGAQDADTLVKVLAAVKEKEADIEAESAPQC